MFTNLALANNMHLHVSIHEAEMTFSMFNFPAGILHYGKEAWHCTQAGKGTWKRLESKCIYFWSTKLWAWKCVNLVKIKLMISPARQKVCLIWTPLLNIHNNLVEIVETTKCLGVYPIFSVIQTAESIGVIFQVNPNVHHNSLLSLYAL